MSTRTVPVGNPLVLLATRYGQSESFSDRKKSSPTGGSPEATGSRYEAMLYSFEFSKFFVTRSGTDLPPLTSLTSPVSRLRNVTVLRSVDTCITRCGRTFVGDAETSSPTFSSRALILSPIDQSAGRRCVLLSMSSFAPPTETLASAPSGSEGALLVRRATSSLTSKSLCLTASAPSRSENQALKSILTQVTAPQSLPLKFPAPKDTFEPTGSDCINHSSGSPVSLEPLSA